MAVGIGENADAVALFERILDQPFEGAPIRMHLDRALDPRVVRHLDVGVAAADVGEHDAILVLQRLEQLLGAVGVAGKVALVIDESMRGAMDLSPLAHEQDVAVTAQTRVARPFIAREDDERPVLVVGARQFVQLVPERRW